MAHFNGSVKVFGLSTAGASTVGRYTHADCTQFLSFSTSGNAVLKMGDYNSNEDGHLRAPVNDLQIDAQYSIVLKPGFFVGPSTTAFLKIANLSTTNPAVANAVWNNGGVLAISSG